MRTSQLPASGRMVIGLFSALATGASLLGGGPETLKVGVQPDGSIVVPTNQVLRPAGKQVTFPGRPVDLALTDAGRTLIVKNQYNLVFIDTATLQIRQSLATKAVPPNYKSMGFSVVGLVV